MSPSTQDVSRPQTNKRVLPPLFSVPEITGSEDFIPYETEYIPLQSWQDEIVTEFCDTNLDKNRIRPSTSEWAAPVLVHPCENPLGEMEEFFGCRVIIDYRELSKRTASCVGSLPRISEVFNKLLHADTITLLTINLESLELQLHEDDIPKTAFVSREGKFEWTVLPFFLTELFPKVAHKVLNDILETDKNDFILVYFNEIIIFSADVAIHKEHTAKVLSIISANNLRIDPKKCQWMQDEIKFLGHLVSGCGVKIDPDRAREIATMIRPKTYTELRKLLDRISIYRTSIRNYAKKVHNLRLLVDSYDTFGQIPQGRIINWESTHDAEFDNIKQALLYSPPRSHFDPAWSSVVVTDASPHSVGAVLYQIHWTDTKELRPVECFSRWVPEDRAMDDLEIMAITSSICKAWDHLLKGRYVSIGSSSEIARYIYNISKTNVEVSEPLETEVQALNRIKILRFFSRGQLKHSLDVNLDHSSMYAEDLGVLVNPQPLVHPTRNHLTGDLNRDIQRWHQWLGHPNPSSFIRYLTMAFNFTPDQLKPTLRDISKQCGICRAIQEIPTCPSSPDDQISLDGPSRKWGIDVKGPFPESRDGNCYAGILFDYESVTGLAVLLPSRSEENIEKILYHGLDRYGTPEQVITSVSVPSETLNAWFEKYGVQHTVLNSTRARTSHYSKQLRYQHLLGTVISTLYMYKTSNWDMLMPNALLISNSNVCYF